MMVELSEARQQAIRAEEIFRDAVRKKLDEEGSEDNGFWKALNQPFAIWVLSTLLVGLVGWAYTELHASWVLREQNSAAIEKLNSQGAIRIEFAQLLLEKAVTTDDYSRAIDVLLNDTTFVRLNSGFRHIFEPRPDSMENHGGIPCA